MAISPTVPPFKPPLRDAGLEALFLDEQLCFALYATSLAMTKVYRPLLLPVGLSYPQYVVVLALMQHGELTAGRLGEHVALDSGTLVPLVRKLATLGLVKRERNPLDDRSVLISLTDAGRQRVQSTQLVKEQIACATQLTPLEIQTLMQSLKKLRAALMRGTAAPGIPVIKPTT